MDHKEKFKKSLDDWAKTEKLTTHQELAKASFLAMLKTSPAVTAFSIWLLLITGTTAMLIISNLAEITKIIPPASIKAVLFMLILSAIAGFLVKCISLYIDIFLQTNDNINELFSTIFKKHNSKADEMETMAGELTEPPNMDIDINIVLKELTEPMPKWYGKKILFAAEKTKKDPLWGFKRYTKLLLGMGVATITQLVLFILCVFVIAVFI